MSNTRFQIANWPSAFLWAGVLLIFGGSIGEVIGIGRRWLFG